MTYDNYDTLGGVLKHHSENLLKFGKRMGWARSVTYMKLDRQRDWTIAEYERALNIVRGMGIVIPRKVMMKFAVRREVDGN